jgi:NAD+ synthase
MVSAVESPEALSSVARPTGWEAAYATRLVDWLRQVATEAGLTGGVFGLSGGLDSAVVAGLAVRAFPGHALGLILPCGSAAQDVEDALAVAAAFELPVRIVTLDAVFEAMLKAIEEPGALPTASGAAVQRLALANLRVRLRAVTWYYHANRLGRLVIGTSNRSELTVGYFTKFGDGAADVLPLAGLVKAEVRDLARYLGVPREVIVKAPTAGLWPGQTDEGEMGLTYEILDRFILGGEVPEDAAGRIRKMATAGEHKRRPPQRPGF